jgi:hypothetical protein
MRGVRGHFESVRKFTVLSHGRHIPAGAIGTIFETMEGTFQAVVDQLPLAQLRPQVGTLAFHAHHLALGRAPEDQALAHAQHSQRSAGFDLLRLEHDVPLVADHSFLQQSSSSISCKLSTGNFRDQQAEAFSLLLIILLHFYSQKTIIKE